MAHGWMAKRRGDNTAELMGRLTMNPFAHADILGTFILPAIGMLSNLPVFGWAKPVPVNERNLKKPRVDLFWIAAAGPLSNLLLAVVCMSALILTTGNSLEGGVRSLFVQTTSGLEMILRFMVLINLILAFFNLVPVHPLDGGKIIARFLSPKANSFLEDNQGVIGMILMVLALSGMLGIVILPLVDLTIRYVGMLLGFVLLR
ncbi:MAG: site-2 protease family protein [Bdellovibrionales bacterium]|nr:site-2 protease family protein [Bdellovibrionales bacterium]